MTGRDVYDALRRAGRIVLPAAMERERQIALSSAVRRLALRDGLAIVQQRRRRGGRRPLAWADREPMTLCLVSPDNRDLIVRPDAAEVTP